MSSQSAYRRTALLIVALAQCMVAFDFASVTLSVATIRDALHLSAAETPWIVSAYELTYGGFLLLGGRLADLYGKKRVLVVGLGVFAFFSLLNAAAPNSAFFLAARAFKGIGAALVCPAALSLLTVLSPEGKARHAALGFFVLFQCIGLAAGNLLGGFLSSLNWRGTILFNAVFGVVLLVVALRHLKADKGIAAGRRFDFLGAVLSTLGFGTLSFTVIEALGLGLASPVTWELLGAVILFFGLFILNLRRHPAPLLPLHFFGKRNVIAAALLVFFLACVCGANYQITLFLQDVMGYSPQKTGLALIPFALVTVGAALLVGPILDRFGARLSLIGTLIAQIAALAFYFGLNKESGYWTGIVPGLLLLDISAPLTLAAMRVPATAGLDHDEQGIATGLSYTFEQIGVGFGITTSAAFATFGAGLSGGAPADARVSGFHWAFGATIFFLLLGLGTAFVLLQNRPAVREQAPDEVAPLPLPGAS